MNKYYKVTVKGGHVGRNKYIPIILAIMANNGKDAAYKARWTPRVKHHHKDAIIACEEINIDEYLFLNKINQEDPYFLCKSIQDQKLFLPNIENRLQAEEKQSHVKKNIKGIKKNRYQMKLNKYMINIISSGILEWYDRKSKKIEGNEFITYLI
jgi:hypothetical protein